MKKILAILMAVCFAGAGFAQNQEDPILIEIGDQQIRQSEFLKDFLKAQGISADAPKTACTYEKRKALTDYAEMYLNYRMKLYDAYQQGYDQKRALQKELKNYRDELAQPYLMDSSSMDRIMKEAYERNKEMLHASHILVKCKSHADPADTMMAYHTAMELYRRVTTGGEDFTKVALEYNEKIAKQEMKNAPGTQVDNGDLGYFSVFEMVYPFETGAYSLKEGEISLPVRSAYGYHIIKLHSREPFFGHATMQHIWVSTEDNPEYAAGKIREAYEKLQAGEKFAVVAQNYSDDKRTAINGGLLPDMTLRQIPSEYVPVVNQLNPGEYCEPFQSSFGWHIVRLMTKDALPPFADLVPFYKQRMARDIRAKKPTLDYVEQCKERYHFVDYTQEYESVKGKKGKKVAKASLDNAISVMNDSVFRKRWHYADSMVTDERPLFAIGEKSYGTADLLRYIEANQKLIRNYSLDIFVNERYKEFVAQTVLAYADSRLETDYPEFGALIDEYRQGLMIFSYNDKNIWSRSLNDTLGLAEFYAQESVKKNIDDPDDAPYFWNERAKIEVYTLDSAALAPAKAVKLAQKAMDKNYPTEQLTDLLKDKQNKKAVDSVWVKVEKQVLEEGNQNLVPRNQWHVGIFTLKGKQPRTYQVVCVKEMLNPGLKALNETRGYYINEYQTYLEEQLLEKLREQYHVVFHQEVLDETTY